MNKKHKVTICKLIISAVIYIIAILIEPFIPFEGIIGALVKIILYLIPYLIISLDMYVKVYKRILTGQIFDENLLMIIATIGAFAIHEYSEAVAVVLLYQVGELFESIAVNRSRNSVSNLIDLYPDYANVPQGDNIIKIDPLDVSVGDIIIIKPGEKIPLDCKVIRGKSMVDTSAITGEYVPKGVEKGSELLSGYVNVEGVLYAKVTRDFDNSTVSKILELVENAGDKKAVTEKFITRFAKYYTPIVVIMALLLAVIPSILVGDFDKWIYRACVFLVISCPCALVISVPMSFFGGIGAASRYGILIKGGNYLEALSKTDTIVFDKTGTLTKGEFKITEIYAKSLSEQNLLELAALAEVYSNHPIAVSIKKAYGKEINRNRVKENTEIAGQGVRAIVDGRNIYAGNEKLLSSIDAKGVCCPNTTLGTVVYLSEDREFLGYIVISDTIKDDAKSSIESLKKLGIKKTVMLSGDKLEAAEKVANELSLDETFAQLLPSDKVTQLEKLMNRQKAGKMLSFVGDGVNDAPVLMRADIGIAMGDMGSDAAIEAADVVLMKDKISTIPLAIRIARKTMRVVKENIVFVLLVKFTILILGAIGIAGMWLAIFADVGVSIIAILNSMRSLKIKKL